MAATPPPLRRRRSMLPPAMRNQPFLLFGLPMLLFVVAGSIGLSQFAQAKYQIEDKRRLVSARAAHVRTRPRAR